jgi:elongator complex protein 3
LDFSTINLADHQEVARAIVKEAVGKKFKDRADFQRFRNRIIKIHKGTIFHNLYFVEAYKNLLESGEIEANESFLKLIQKRSVRTMSGVTPVTVLTKPFPCPGKCVYCPTDVRMPKSYLMTQPAAQRGFRQQFNPYSQVFVRLKALQMAGHEISKVELRVLGGTWSSYPTRYQTWFIKRCLQAMNEFYAQIIMEESQSYVKSTVHSPYGDDEINTLIVKSIGANLSLESTIKQNETSLVRCISINIETRPDSIDEKEIFRLRKLGVTKVEIGVQTTDDAVQELTKRGHDLAEVRRATALLKDAGFKLSYHMMPNLPGSTIELDKRMVGELFENSEYQPDYLKIYPCVVIPRTILASWHKKGEFIPYSDAVLEEVLVEELKSVPEWCRVDRLARDIPANEIQAGFTMSNIRQVVEKKLADAGTPPREIRYREIGDADYKLDDVKLFTREYAANGGKEFFISYEDVKQDKLIALIRLRFTNKNFIREIKNSALIREVHVYGKQVAVGGSGVTKQHVGWGTKLMDEAERVAREAGYKKIAVIAGIGTREYYKKLGYELEGTYMVKSLS